MRERQRDRAAARPDVDHARALREPERDLDEQLGLRPRHEHARVDEQVDMAKALAPEDVGDGLAPDRAPPHRVLKSTYRGTRDLATGIGEQRGAVDAERLGEQQLGIQARRVRPGRADRDHRGVQRLADRRPAERGDPRHAVAWSSSARRFSSFCNAVVNSSSAPSSTSSRLCAVKLMR